jgi:hypothetical protein
MSEFRTNRSSHALRVCPKALDSGWWAAAQERRADAPRAVNALLSGRTRVELTAEEAVLAIHWAAQLTGRDDYEQHPMFIYPPLEPGEG